MNIAAGNPLERGKYLNQISPLSYLNKLMVEKFNGYICIGIHGKSGLEEGTIVFHNGDIVSSDYEYYRYNKSYKAEDGLKRSLNSLFAGIGVIDSFSLSSYQVQLILTLNEEANLRQKINKESLSVPASFSSSYEEELMEKAGEEEVSREELLKRFGLTRLAGQKSTRTQLMEQAKKQDVEIPAKPKKQGERLKTLGKLLKKR